MLYLLAAIIGFIGGVLYHSSRPSPFDTQLMSKLKLGKRVVICIDNEATIFEMIGGRIKVTKGYTDFQEDLANDNVVDIVQPSQSVLPSGELPTSLE